MRYYGAKARPNRGKRECFCCCCEADKRVLHLLSWKRGRALSKTVIFEQLDEMFKA